VSGYAELHGIIFYCNKTVCMTFRAKSAKSTVIPLLQLGGQSIKSVTQYKYLVIVFDTELSDDKGIQRQLRYQYCVANKLRATFSQCSNAFKNVLFVPFVCPCMHHKYGVISGSHACRVRVAYYFGCRALYNLPWPASIISH